MMIDFMAQISVIEGFSKDDERDVSALGGWSTSGCHFNNLGGGVVAVAS